MPVSEQDLESRIVYVLVKLGHDKQTVRQVLSELKSCFGSVVDRSLLPTAKKSNTKRKNRE